MSDIQGLKGKALEKYILCEWLEAAKTFVGREQSSALVFAKALVHEHEQRVNLLNQSSILDGGIRGISISVANVAISYALMTAENAEKIFIKEESLSSDARDLAEKAFLNEGTDGRSIDSKLKHVTYRLIELCEEASLVDRDDTLALYQQIGGRIKSRRQELGLT